MSEVVEMNMWESLVKLNEKLTFFILNVKNKSDKGVTDDDYVMVKPICRLIWDGELQFFKQVLPILDETAEQQGLFTDRTTDETTENSDGTEIATTMA